MTTRSLTLKIAAPTALGLLIAIGLTFSACKKDEAPPPLPSAEEPEPAASAMELELAPEEDAGADADAESKAKGPYKPKQSLANCCAALKQNAASAPAPTNTYMLAAAGVCDGVVASGLDRNAALAQIRAAMKGTPLPGACY
jgi:hypothetical protein